MLFRFCFTSMGGFCFTDGSAFALLLNCLRCTWFLVSSCGSLRAVDADLGVRLNLRVVWHRPGTSASNGFSMRSVAPAWHRPGGCDAAVCQTASIADDKVTSKVRGVAYPVWLLVPALTGTSNRCTLSTCHACISPSPFQSYRPPSLIQCLQRSFFQEDLLA